jgi:peptide-methionine (S)-S-oxide reductase
VVLVVFDPAETSAEDLLALFWENHDPTQGPLERYRPSDQYRSPIFYPDSVQHKAAVASKLLYQRALSDTGQGIIVTEIAPLMEFFYAESYHQQYLRK